jgi:hypothetical protein
LAPASLAGVDGLAQESRARLRGRGIEEDGVAFLGQRLVEVGGPARHIELLGKTLELVGVAAHKNRIGHHAVAVGKQHTALVADRDDRADQMLVEPHAAGDPVHDHAEALRRHIACSFRVLAFA